MFEFCGEITGACKDEALKEERLAGFLASILVKPLKDVFNSW